jgi:hypothetical protein
MKTIEVMVRSAREIALGLLAYVILLVGSASFLLKHPMGPVPAAFLLISPVIPVAFILRSMVQLLRHSDELEQRIQLLAVSFSFASTALLGFTYERMRPFFGFSPMPSALILPLMVVLWLCGLFFFRRRFQ